MQVLVTGAKGFVGRHVCSHLEAGNMGVLEVDLRGGQLRGDITERDFVFHTLGAVSFDAVVHLAAIADIGATVKDPYTCFNVNCFGTLNMLELAARKNVHRFIYMSSANVYGRPSELPVKETSPFNPRVPYDYSKVIGENLVRSYHAARHVPSVILRSWKLFGEYEPFTKAIPCFIRASLMAEPIILHNGGRDTTDPYYIGDYCRVVGLCLKNDKAVGHAFNVGTGVERSIKEISDKIREMTSSSSITIVAPPRSEQETEPMRSYPSIEKISSILEFRPAYSLEDGLQRTVNWVKDALEEERQQDAGSMSSGKPR